MDKLRDELIKKGLIKPGEAPLVACTEMKSKPVVAVRMFDDRPKPRREQRSSRRGGFLRRG